MIQGPSRNRKLPSLSGCSAILGALVLMATLVLGVSPAQACHTLPHCIEEEIEEEIGALIEQVGEEVARVAEGETFACAIQGRTSVWSNDPNTPYTFVGPASCARLDHDGAVDEEDSTQLYPSFPEEGDAEFELSGVRSADTMSTCTMSFDGGPGDGGQLRLDNDGDGVFDETISFPYRMDSVAGQAALAPHPAEGTSPMKAYGAANLVATDVIEDFGETFPNTDPGCITSDPADLFIDGVIVLQSDNAAHQPIP